MAVFHFSIRAEADLLAIADYTLHKWGEAQVARYLDSIETCCKMLAENPTAGRSCEEIRPGLRRLEHGRHVIFYRLTAEGVLISRILHERMLPERHAIDDEGAAP